MRKYHHIKINLPGGIVAAGDLYACMEAAERCGIELVQFGNRQQLYCRADITHVHELKKELDKLGVFSEVNNDEYPNILTSYVAEDVFQNANWLSEGVYKDILGMFDYRPTLKVSLVDANQTFIPFFTGSGRCFISVLLNTNSSQSFFICPPSSYSHFAFLSFHPFTKARYGGFS